MARIDASAKASGKGRYVDDIVVPGMIHGAVVRSSVSHGEITAIDSDFARSCPGVIGVYMAADLPLSTYGRSVYDVPLLAHGKVRFIGEPVVAVVAKTRIQAELAALRVEVSYQPLVPVESPEEAMSESAPAIHEAPWNYPNAHIGPDSGRNVQARGSVGDLMTVERALASAPFAVDEIYRTPAVHQGYLEPWACIASVEMSGRVKLWCTNKSPHIMVGQISDCLAIDRDLISVEPILIGGDFGGKGSPGLAPLCIELSRRVGAPVKVVLRYSEELTSTNPRHSSQTRVRIGCDTNGDIVAASVESLLDGGAYAGFNPTAGALGGSMDPSGYRIAAFYAASTIVYTNSVPKGNMRAPGSPQYIFALESAVDELALAAGIGRLEIRRRNLLRDGEKNAAGQMWREFRGVETLDAATKAPKPHAGPPGWRVGRGWSIYAKPTKTEATMSFRMIPKNEGGIRVEIPVTETGTGSHSVMHKLITEKVGFADEDVEIVQVPSNELPRGINAGGSRVTSSMSIAAGIAAKIWNERTTDGSLTIDVNSPRDEFPVGSYAVQCADVAVDPETGQFHVLQLLSVVDVAEVVNVKAHQMQIDGGTLMGYGFACLEDLGECDGQVWAANLSEFKMPSMRDAPHLETRLLRGGMGVGIANVKNIGELTTPPTAAAIANAIHAATGCRIRELPITAERVFNALASLKMSE